MIEAVGVRKIKERKLRQVQIEDKLQEGDQI